MVTGGGIPSDIDFFRGGVAGKEWRGCRASRGLEAGTLVNPDELGLSKGSLSGKVV